jgi:RNA polymerase sigma factor (sigma-70 family)
MENVPCNEQWITTEWVIEKYDLYKTLLFRIAYSYLGNKHDCEDILQESFIKLYYNSPNFSTEEDEKRWMIRITINLCKNQLKNFWNKKKVSIEDIGEYSYEPEEVNILNDLLNLPDKYKSVIHLYYFEGYKISEIKEILKLSESAVKMRLKRGRELLKIELEDSL